MATGASLTNTREIEFLNFWLRATAMPSAPAGLFAGLLGAPIWVTGVTALGGSAIAVGTYVLPTPGNQNGHIYRASAVSGTHTTGATEPTWPTGIGATVVDNAGANQITWQEATMFLDGVTDAGAHPAELITAIAASYARISVGQTNFPAATAIGGSTTGSRSLNGTAVTFAAATGNWAPAVGMILSDSVTNGKYLFYGMFASYLQVGNGQQAQFNVSGITASVD